MLRESEVRTNKLSIHSVYPNPFNPSTQIQFEIPKEDIVALRAYDVKGNLVEEIFNKQISLGIHEFTWQPENISSGTYFIQCKTSNSIKTQKVVYLK